MNNPSSSTKKSKSFMCFVFMLFVGIVSMLTFSACQFTNSGSSQESNFDASGRLKVLTPVIDFNSNTGGRIDENSGSFSWAIEYYYSGSSADKLKDIGYDQGYLFSNFYSDASYEQIDPVNKPNSWNGTCWKNGPDYLYAKCLELNASNISFPSFEVVVDGKYFTFQVSVNKAFLGQYTGQEIADMFNSISETNPYSVKRNLFYDKSDGKSLFTFKYRTGKNNNNGDFIDCPKGMMSYYTDSTTGEFCVRFNPQLEFGSVNRYLKVKALAEGERASSNYSATCSFEAYALSFEVYSPNSATLDYGGLEYDKEKYYFAYEKTYYNEYLGANSIKSLTGYFPEGRLVEVSRKAPYKNADGTFANGYNYAFQSWTTNAKAENSVSIDNKFPANSPVYNYGTNVLSDETKNKSDAFSIVPLNSIVHNLYYHKKSEVTASGLDKVMYNYSPAVRQTIEGASYNTDKIVVASHNVVNGYKFYANYAKVRGFMQSGSFFAGDNFFTARDQNLTGVNINLFYKIGGVYQSRLITGNLSQEDLGISSSSKSHKNGVKVTIDGSYFKIEGLEYDDFIIFSKEGQPLISENVMGESKPYSFHSPLMKEKQAFGSVFKGLDLVVDSKTYSDRQDVGIIGTQYAEQSNLIVNLYRLKDTKNTDAESVPSSYLELLKDSNISYEVIKSVSSFEDANGYITTNIIISLILPSNATLTGYNVETLNNASKEYYKCGDNIFVTFLKYNASTMKNEAVYLDGNKISVEGGTNTLSATFPMYLIKKAPISGASGKIQQTLTSQFISYNGKYYVYDHKEIGGYLSSNPDEPTAIYLYKNSDKSESEPDFLIKEGDSWFELRYVETNVSAKVDKDTLEPVYSYDSSVLTKVSSAGDIYSVSTIANAYQTNMKHVSESSTPAEEQTVYVYYDVKNVGGENYYTAPIGRQDVVTVSDGNTQRNEIQDVLYFGEISNFNELRNANKIMLGSEIYKRNNGDAQAFREALGSKIILNCYYYIVPLGEETELHFKQYINNYEDSNETQTVIEYYYQDGLSYKKFEGTPVADSEKVNKTEFNFYNEQGILIDSKYNFSRYESLTGEKLNGNLLDPTHVFEGSKNFNNTFTLDGKTFTQKSGGIFEYGGKNYGVLSKLITNGVGRTVSLYVANTADGTFSEIKLYCDENGKYHKIIGSVYIYYDNGTFDADGNAIRNVELFDIFDTSEIEFTTGTGSYLESITVKSLKENGVSVPVSYNVSERIYNGVYGTTKNSTHYLYYVVNSYAKYDSEGKVLENYYPIVKYGVKEELVLKHSPSMTALVNYKSSETDGKPLYKYTTTKQVYNFKTALVRSAQTTSGNTDVTVLGKYIITNDQSNPKIYPSFSSFLQFSEDDAFILDRNSNGEYNYYSMDYTITKNAIEGFPGITLLAGLPYPNPVLNFKVRHKAYETPIINIALDVNNAYYVEVVGSNILSDESNLVRDFTTYSFRDTIENLTQNDYLDKTYWVLDRTNFNPVYALVETDDDTDYVYYDRSKNKYYNYYIYTAEENDAGDIVKTASELTIQNIGLNDNDDVIYSSLVRGANGKYYKPLYILETNSMGSKVIRKLTCDDVLLWKTSSTTISGAPTYDIHSYTQGKDGIIYFNSGSSNDENIICNGLSGISAGATKNSNGFFNYDEVMISGVTYAYRTLASQVNNSSNMSGYQFDKMINILNAYNSKDAYFLTGKESAVLVASPIVKLNDDAGNSYIYRFREWKIYSRYNSEVLYYNRGVTESLEDRYNAILRFTSSEAGYFVMFPVYERVFNVDTGTAVIDGAINQGGGVNIAYNNGDELDVKNSYDDKLYFVNYYKTTYQGKEGYFYGSLQGYPFLYFTGNFYGGDTTKPVFSRLENVFVSEYEGIIPIGRTSFNSGKVPMFFQVNNGSIKYMNVITSFESGKPGLVLLLNENGQYTYYGFNNQKSHEDDKGFYLDDNTNDNVFQDIINVSFTATFFYNEINKSASTSSIPLHYNSTTKIFTSLDIDAFDNAGNSFLSTLIAYNMKFNSVLFNDENVFKLIGDTVYHCSCSNDPCTCSYTTSAKLSTVLSSGDKVASSSYNIFTVIKRVDNPLVNELYISRLGSLSAGELVKDEDGNIYSTQQFKTAYIDRDSYVELQAIPQSGYRFEGWYKCIYDTEGGFWYTTDEKVTNSGDIYSDEIINAVYNEDTKQYYYVTSYEESYSYNYIEDDVTKSKKVYQYFYDEEHHEPAIVPSRMLDKVRGFFINTGTKSVPNYVQVYPKGVNFGVYEFYYEANFINRVDTTKYDIEERTYISSIRSEDIVDAGYVETWYFLSNAVVFFNPNNNRYYREKTTGNVVVDGNKLKITTLHSNIRYVAKFIETYNEYIFAEDEESSGIKIQAVYYSNSKMKYDADNNPIIRTDVDGVNHTAGTDPEIKYDTVSNVLDSNIFPLYDEKKGKTQKYLSTYSNMITGRYQNENGVASYEEFKKLLVNGWNAKNETYRVNELDPVIDGKLNLKSMYFDVDTTVHIVVRVKSDFELSFHTLGVNSRYEITPIFSPTDSFIKENQKAKTEDKIDYLYYIFKLTYNRDPENQYSSYIVHPNRGENMAYDALVGNYVTFYRRYFKYYDNLGKEILFSTNADGKIRLLPSYLTKVCSNETIVSEIASNAYDNIEKALYDLCLKMKKPGTVICSSIYLFQNIEKCEKKQYSTLDDIYDVLKEILKDNRKPAPYIIRSGQRNFVNLSTIPIFNYTVQALLIDSEGDQIKYDEKSKKIILPSLTLDLDNCPVSLANSLYTAGGINGKTFLGGDAKQELTEPYLYKQYDESGTVSTTVMPFDTLYSDIEYALGDGGKPNPTLFQDLTFVQNSIILFRGIEKVPSGYLFAGWYEQKYDRDSEEWSELVFMSNDEQVPYISLATADTVVVAIYKRAVEVTFEYDNREMAYEMSNGLVDSTGNKLTIKDNPDGGIVTLSGNFFFDAKIEAIISSAGGYRFNGIDYTATAYERDANGNIIKDEEGNPKTKLVAEGNSLNKYFLFSNYVRDSLFKYKFEECEADANGNTYTSAILNSILKVEFNLNTAIRSSSDDKAVVCDKLVLKMTTKKLTLVYFTVENFRAIIEGLYFLSYNSGYNFALIKKATETSAEKVLFRTVTNYHEISKNEDQWIIGKDSTNSLIQTSCGNDLVVYGYFDSDLVDSLLLVTIKDEASTNTIREWYLNGNLSQDKYTAYYEQLASSYTIKDRTISSFYKFDIMFEYSGELEPFNGDEYFALTKDNAVYYAKAIIDTGNLVTSISHKIVENIHDVSNPNKATIPTGATVNTLLSFNGRLQNADGAGSTLENDAIPAEISKNYVFETGSSINLKAYSPFIIYNGKLYAFVGWFYRSSEADNVSYLISYKDSIYGKTPKGLFEAIYVRANAVDQNIIPSMENADITFENIQNINEISLSNQYTESDQNTRNVVIFNEIVGASYVKDTGVFATSENTLKYVLVGSDFKFTITPIIEHMIESCTVVGALQGNLEFVSSSNPDYTNAKDYVISEIQANDHLQITAQVQKGYILKIKQTLYSSFDMSTDGKDLSDEAYIHTVLRDSASSTYDTLDEIIVPLNTIVQLTNRCEKYYLIGYFINGEIVSKENGKYLETYSRSINQNIVIEARYTFYNYVAVSDILVPGTSKISTFKYSLTYTDPRTNTIAKCNNARQIYAVPAGIVADLKLESNWDSNPYKFVGFKNISSTWNIVSTFSTNKETQIALTLDKRYAKSVSDSDGFTGKKHVEFIHIGAIFESATKLTVKKDITLGVNNLYITDGSGKNMTEEQLNGLFNIVVEYTDSSNTSQRISMSSELSTRNVLSDIKIMKGTSFKIIPVLDPSIKHRYMVYDFDFKDNGSSKKYNVTQNDDGSFTVDGDEKYSSLEFTVYFRPCKMVTLVKEILDTESDDSNILVDYSFLDSNRQNASGTLKDESRTLLNVNESNTKVSLSASVLDSDQYMFVGWYADGSYKGVSSSIDISGASVITAKFAKIVSIKSVKRTLVSDISGNNVKDISSSSEYGEVYVTGNFIDGKEYSVKTKTLAEIKNGAKVVAGTKISIFTGRKEGTHFRRFSVYKGDVFNEYSLSNNNANKESDGFSAIIESADTEQDISITVEYEKAYDISYHVSTINTESSSGNGLELVSDSTAHSYYYSNASKTIDICAKVKSGYNLRYVYINGYKVDFDIESTSTTGGITTMHLSCAIGNYLGSNLVVKLEVYEIVTVRVYVSLGENISLDKVNNVQIIAITKDEKNRDKTSYYTLTSGTIFADINNIYAFDDLTIAITNNSYTYNSKAYTFTGFYLYDGSSFSTSVSPVSHKSSFSMVANNDISIVAKYEADKKPSTTKTITLADEGSDLFVGWYARVNDTTSSTGYRDIMISKSNFSEGYFSGKFSLIVRKYASIDDTKTVGSLSGTTGSGHAEVYTNANSVLAKNILLTRLDDNFTINNAISRITSSSIKYIADDGFSVSNSGVVSQKYFKIEVVSKLNRVDSNNISSSSSDQVTIKEDNKSVNVTISIPSGIGSEVEYTILYNDNAKTTITGILKTGNLSYSVTVPVGSTIYLSYKLVKFEKFVNYHVKTPSIQQSFSTASLSYCIPTSTSTVEITVNIGKSYTSTIYENDKNKGMASVESIEDGAKEKLTVASLPGYAISAIYVAEISETGTIGSFKEVLKNNANLQEYLGIGVISSISNSSADSFGGTYVQKVIYNFTPSKHIAFKIEYKKITTVTYNLAIDDNDKDHNVKTVLTKYYTEDESPLTLAKIEALNLPSKMTEPNVEFANYTLNNEEITNETEIEFVDNNIIIFANFNLGYILQVRVNLVKDESADYATPSNGITVTLDDGLDTLVATDQISRSFGYLLKKAISVRTIDANNFYEFIGYYSSKSQNSSTLLSSSASYSFGSKEIVKLSTEEIDGETAYIIYATLKERIQTLTIEKDYEMTDFNLYHNGTRLEATAENQIVSSGANGNIAYKQGENGSYIISYPYSILSTDMAFEIRQEGFNSVTDDPMILNNLVSTSVFYEKKIGESYYRFDNFYDENDFAIGKKYSSSFTVQFSKYRIGGKIVAKLVKLNQVEFIYDVSDENIIIKLQLLNIAGGATNYIDVATSNGKSTIGEAVLTYRAEAETVLRVFVDFKNYTGENKFSSILVSDKDEQMISKIFSNSDQISTINWTNKLSGYTPVSKYMNSDNPFNGYVSANKTSAFNFTPTTNMSFVADFIGFVELDRMYIVSDLFTTNITPSILDSSWGSKSAISGNGFKFRAESVGSTISVIKSNTTLERYLRTSYIDQSSDDKTLTVGKSGTVHNGQFNFHSVYILTAQITVNPKIVLKSQNGVGYISFDNIEASSNGRGGILMNGENKSYAKYERTNNSVVFSAPSIDGYIFKGFALTSVAYSSAYKIMQLSGEDAIIDAQTLNIIGIDHFDKVDNKITRFYSKSVAISGETRVIAIYEPRVYIIKVNTYKYFEDNELGDNGDENRMFENRENMDEESYSEIEASTIKGSLLVQHDQSIKITSINYQFIQFAGISTTREFNNKNIRFAYDTGEGTSILEIDKILKDNSKYSTDLEEYKNYLHEKELGNVEDTGKNLFVGKLNSRIAVPGQIVQDGEDEDDIFATSSSTNNFYALNVTQDFTVNFFYTALSYNLIIDLAETESTFVYGALSGGNGKGNSSTYLAYSEEVRSAPGWKNPSAGTYNYTVNYGTNEKNKGDTSYTIVIEENDPFVYVANDNNDTEIGYPTKISERLVMLTDYPGDVRKKYLFYRKNANSSRETNMPGVEVQIATCGAGGRVVGETMVFNAIDGLVSKENSLRKYGLDHNMPEIDKNGNVTLRNIYNYVDIVDKSISLKKNLFTIVIDGDEKVTINSQNVSSKNIKIDLVSGTVRFKYKVVATENGFPRVTVTQRDATNKSCDLDDTISKAEVRNVTITSNKQTEAETQTGKTELVGFNLALFEDDSAFESNFVLGNIDVKLRMLWQTMAKPVDVSVAFNNSDGTRLTGNIGTGSKGEKKIDDVTENECGTTGNGYLTKKNEHGEILSYQIFVVKNGYMFVDYIQQIVNKTKDTDKEAASFAMSIFDRIFGNPVGDVNEYGKIVATSDFECDQGTIYGERLGTGATGHLLDPLESLFFLLYLSTYTDYYIPAENLESEESAFEYLNGILQYRAIDAYELYCKGVDGNFYNNCINTGDLVITQCFLQEHQTQQVNHYGGWLGWLWTADKAYSYYRAASATYQVTKDQGSFTADYTNDLTMTADNGGTKIKDKSFGQSIVSIFNSAKGNAGNYNRFITVGFAPNNHEFKTNDSILAKVVIDTAEEKRVLTSMYDYQPVPIVNAVFSIFLELLIRQSGIGTIVMTVDNIICIFQPDRRGLQDIFRNMF